MRINCWPAARAACESMDSSGRSSAAVALDTGALAAAAGLEAGGSNKPQDADACSEAGAAKMAFLEALDGEVRGDAADGESMEAYSSALLEPCRCKVAISLTYQRRGGKWTSFRPVGRGVVMSRADEPGTLRRANRSHTIPPAPVRSAVGSPISGQTRQLAALSRAPPGHAAGPSG